MESKVSKFNYIYQQMKNDIESGQLSSNDRLFIENLARDFDSTERCINSVVDKLKQEGLLHSASLESVVVADISYRKIENILAIREVLESFAAKIAAYNIDEIGLINLRALLKNMQECFDKNDINNYEQFDREFHAAIAAYSLNSELIATIKSLEDSQSTSIYKLENNRESMATSLIEHRLIVDHLYNKDGELAEKMVYIHWKKYYDRFREIYKNKQAKEC